MNPKISSLDPRLITALLPPDCRTVYVAYSGGVDSHVLLHLAAVGAGLQERIVAVYVNHGLQASADAWGEHCRRQCLELRVAFQIVKVDAVARNGEGPEAAAREARYRALRPLLEEGDVLLLAQHREDQAETLLLQLFRGAGVAGLAGMPVDAAFGRGRMLRPFLDKSKKDICDYARANHLQWVDDPSNQSSDFDRNFLRNQILPLLKQRWPALDKTVARSAAHCGEASRMLEDWVGPVLAEMLDPESKSICLAGLSRLSDSQRRFVLRKWLTSFGLKPPSAAVIDALTAQATNRQGKTSAPQLQIQGYHVLGYRQKLFCIPAVALDKFAGNLLWPKPDTRLDLGNGYGLVRAEACSGIAKAHWDGAEVSVKARVGGEKLKLSGRAGHHCLKKLYQEAAIPPWERDQRPLLYMDGRLAAVAGLWVAEWAWASGEAACYRVDWKASRWLDDSVF
ncbi:tRNA lysidine(34) synthetase TilS [Methylomonas sp. EFPC3]|uniref:tRNA lysidine(34) synthetase TilS n=1 Tax=Methylomonas sp. EFPC3 TaxID=3021710 RepID=UPI0024169999|nr:tRNA lysidine(34) synthetase TilS [Methylomonas sp. EFPC3]WFP48454.1 tRNA lysidine(34) synthetase TilS [Methylomonas sp. EFPC3]